MLAGVWTKGSLDQLRSNGFSILLIPYETIIDVFRQLDINIYYEEKTEDRMLQTRSTAGRDSVRTLTSVRVDQRLVSDLRVLSIIQHPKPLERILAIKVQGPFRVAPYRTAGSEPGKVPQEDRNRVDFGLPPSPPLPCAHTPSNHAPRSNHAHLCAGVG